MYRIIAITACAAVLSGLTLAAAPAATCDERVAGSCPIEPIPEEAATAEPPAATKPMAYARADKERSVRRVRTTSRRVSPAERRRTAAVVARAIARERARAGVEAERDQAQSEPQRPQAQPEPPPQQVELKSRPSGAFTMVSAVAASPPSLAPMLSPTLAFNTDLVEPSLEPRSIVVADTQTTRAAQSEPAPARAMSGQAGREPPAPAAAAGPATEAGQPPNEPAQVASATFGAVDSPWLRLAFLTFGGLLALGSAIRLFV